jgi:hypothetical protein
MAIRWEVVISVPGRDAPAGVVVASFSSKEEAMARAQELEKHEDGWIGGLPERNERFRASSVTAIKVVGFEPFADRLERERGARFKERGRIKQWLGVG